MCKRYFVIVFLLSMAVFPAASRPGFAVQEPPAAEQQSADRFLMLVPPRDMAEIQRDLESAEQARAAAAEAERQAQEQRTAAAARLDDKKQAIAANKDRQKAAKRQKNESEVLLLKAEEKALERDKDLLEQRGALRDAEINLARMRNELATLVKQALDLERQLAEQRAEQAETSVSGPESARAARRLIDLERATLEAQKRIAEKQGEVADAARKVIERQLATLEAQQNIYGGR